MHILLSAYACRPHAGSEESNGWTWAHALADRHRVTVLTDRDNRPGVEAELARLPDACAPEFVYVGDGAGKHRGRRRWPYYYRWQRLALRRALELHARTPFDVVHHVTYGGLRIPSYLWRLGVPMIWGPIGGGESVPLAFYRPPWMSPEQAAKEWFRDLWNRWCRLDPRIRATARHAQVIGVTTAETGAALPPSPAARIEIMPSSVLHRADRDRVAQRRARPGPETGLRLLFVGRLIGWKGPGLALAAFARYVRAFPDAHLDLYGDGPMRGWLVERARALGVADHVTFKGIVPREQLLSAYADYQLFLFPSMHDSSGFASLEAMAAGLPVVCLDTGGPGAAVPPEAGWKVPVTTPRRAVPELAAGLAALTRDRRRWQAASDTARRHALRPESTPDITAMIRQLYGDLLDQRLEPAS